MSINKEAIRTIEGDYAVVRISFKNLTEFEMYLQSNPPVNKKIFTNQMSLRANKEFAGESLEQAISYCHGGYRENFDQFLTLKKMMDSVNVAYSNRRKTVTSVVGSRPNVPAYIAGAPKTMYRTERVKEKKFIDIYFNLAYSGFTTEQQVLNRGIITLNLVDLLEKSGIGVNLHVFEACYVQNEIFLADIAIKKPGDPLNIGKCYYPLCSKEFVRRLMLRVKESMPFKQNWGVSYGMILDESKVRDILKIDDKKILILAPGDMGINGKNLFDDADACIDILNLKDTVSLPKYRMEAES